MSWQAARKEARLVLDRANLSNERLAREIIDLEAVLTAQEHPSQGRFRVMIMQAMHRVIEGRGGTSTIYDIDVKKRRAW
ncbi:MAG: hypothetical protein FWG50_14455 [Kiritimatiellaeota bacterium]|nr:hypothetical protein [Kiritimatiellota bacterium]